MGSSKHVVRFEPVGIEIEVDETQTVLRAAAEQGIMLMHGCKEGQCSACKSFVLEGEDIELDKYSTFALPDFEKDEGFTLLCLAHVYEDVTIELLNYDEEMIRSGHPIQKGRCGSRVQGEGHPRHASPGVRLVEPAEMGFFPGQYVDIAISGTDARSFSMANTSSQGERTARVRDQGLPGRAVLAFPRHRAQVGDRLEVAGPFGVFTLREGYDSDLVFVGGGAGMAPILAVLRSSPRRKSA